MQSIVLRILGSNYHGYLNYFWNNQWGCVWYQNKMVKVSSLQICFQLCNGTLTFSNSVKGLFGHPLPFKRIDCNVKLNLFKHFKIPEDP